MNIFQIECLIYMLCLFFLTICSIKELREIVIDILYHLLIYPFYLVWCCLKSICNSKKIIENPIENCNYDNTLELNILTKEQEYISL